MGHTLWPYWNLWSLLQPGPYRSGSLSLKDIVSSGPKLLPRAMSGSMVLQQSESGLTYVTPVATKGPCRCPRSGQPPEFILVPKSHAVVGAMQVGVAYTATQCPGDVWARAAVEAMSGSMALL